MTRGSVEVESPAWAEPFAGMFSRIRYQSWLLLAAFAVIAMQALLLFNLASAGAAHVYEIHPNGESVYIGDRHANLAPRPAEARYVGKRFVELLYAWNSSTVHADVTEAVNMCSPAMAEQLRAELAEAQFVSKLRARQIRSEVVFDLVEVFEEGARNFRIRLLGRTDVYTVSQYEGQPIETRPFAVSVVAARVPRDPDLRLNGLEIVRIVREVRSDLASKKGRP